MEDLEKLYVDCDCETPDHFVKFMYDAEDIDFKAMFLTTHLRKNGLFERLVYATKYVCGYQSKFGCFEETIINLQKAKELRDFLGGFIKKIEGE